MHKNVFVGLLLFFGMMMNDGLAQDWPNLERFQADNEAMGLPSHGENRIVFMGNSITEGWSREIPEFWEGKPFVNRGISGQTTPQMLIRFRADVVDLKPSAVFILAGINDIAGNTGPSSIGMIFNNIKSMTEIARANGIEVVLCSVLPANDFPWSPGREPAEKVVQLNTLLQQYAIENELFYLDYFTPMVDDHLGLKAEYTHDGVHPTKEGYEVMATLFEGIYKDVLVKLSSQ